MGLTLAQAAVRVASRLNKSQTDAVVTARLKRHINDACQEAWTGYAWSFRTREYPFVTTARVTSGTMTATNGSQTITASGTPFSTTLHVGAWIRFPQDTTEAWYRIQNVASTSSAVIEPAYQGTTASGKTYELVKTDYLMPSELIDPGQFRVSYGRYVALPSGQNQINAQGDFPPTTTGSPLIPHVLRQENIRTTYTTGTLSGTVDTNTLTGSGTAWLANVTEGDSIVIGSDTNVYTVFKVLSDTSLLLYQNLTTAASGASYTISRQYGKVLRLWPASDQAYTCFIRGLRDYPQLINSADTNELLQRFPAAVIESACWREASSSPDSREDSLYQKSAMMWAEAQGQDEAMQPKHNYYPIWNPRA